MIYNSIKHLGKWQQYFAFNVWDLDSAKAVIDAAIEKERPIFLQISSKVFNKINHEEFIYIMKNYILDNRADAIIHLDHSRNIEQVHRAIEAGWDSVMYDGSHLALAENIAKTAKVVEIAKKRNVLVEGEIGQVLGVEDDIRVDKEVQITIEDIERFITLTDVDLLAVAIGTAHGQYGENKPNINYELLGQIENLTKIPFVVHGGSELTDETLKKLWTFENVKKINISTDIKQAYRKGILDSMRQGLLEEKGFDALRVEKQIYETIKSVAVSKLKVLEEI